MDVAAFCRTACASLDATTILNQKAVGVHFNITTPAGTAWKCNRFDSGAIFNLQVIGTDFYTAGIGIDIVKNVGPITEPVQAELSTTTSPEIWISIPLPDVV